MAPLIGAALGFSFSLFGALPWNYILAVLAAIIVCGLLGLRNSSRLAGVTITIIMLVHKEGPRWGLAMDRVGEVVLGIVVALAVTTLVFPDRARLRLRDGLAQEFLLLGSFFEAILEGFRGAPSQNLSTLRDDVQARAAPQQPTAGGRAQRAFRRSGMARRTEHAVAIRPFPLRRSARAAVLRRRQPRRWIRAATGAGPREAGRRYSHRLQSRGRMHSQWRFNVPPQGINLEQDIADLEARMDAVRHTGIGFSQAEILRAYAVQLHLKQIARLLRASRVETSRAVGERAQRGIGSRRAPIAARSKRSVGQQSSDRK